MFVYIDIETIPSQRNESKERAASKVAPPANITKAETLAKWEAEKRPSLEEAEWRKTSLNGGWGELCCVCWAVEDGPVEEAVRPTAGDSEAALLATLFDGLQDAQKAYRGAPVMWVGHNITGFDLRFLWQRAVVLGVSPGRIKLHKDAAPWSGRVIDTMHEWGGRRDFVKLTELCEVLRIDVGHEDTIDGSQVWDRYQAGDFETILTHCRADVARVREVHKRIQIAA